MLTNFQRRVRLILQGKLNNTEIAGLTNCSRNTVSNWRKVIAQIDDAEDVLDGLDDDAIRQIVTPGAMNRNRSFTAPDFEHIAFECAERGVTKQTLFEEYCAQVPVGYHAMSRSTFYRTVNEFLDKKDLVMSFEYAPGEMFQCDFVGRKRLKQPVLIDANGADKNYELFCAVSALSRKIFLIAIEGQAKLPALNAFMRMMDFFAGVPVLVTIDNFPAAVAKPRHGNTNATLTPEFQDFADHYGFGMVAARVRKPRDKGLVENAVGIVQNDVLG